MPSLGASDAISPQSSTEVECYAGARYPERPRAFIWRGERLTVQSVEREWRTPDGLNFRVRATDNRCFLLTYREPSGDTGADTWYIQLLP